MAFHTGAFSESSTDVLATGRAGLLDNSLYYLSVLIALPLYVLGVLGYAIAFMSALAAQILFNCAGTLIERLDCANFRICSSIRKMLGHWSASRDHAARRGR